MTHLHQKVFSDVAHELPDIRPIDDARTHLADIDVFIAVLGFEERTASAAAALADLGCRATNVLLLNYPMNIEDNERRRPLLNSALKALAPTTVTETSVGTIDFPKAIRAAITAATPPADDRLPTVVIDISVASNKLVLRALHALLGTECRLIVLYAEAGTYFPTEVEYKTTELSSGVGELEVSIDHAGVHMDPAPDCLILFPGLEPHRSRAVISKVDQSLLTFPQDRVIWMIGDPKEPEDKWRRKATRELNGLNQPDSEPAHRIVPTFDYIETMRALEEVYNDRVGRYQFTLSPMGSKLQAVGAALFGWYRNEVRVIFATPKRFNAAHYSEGCKGVWAVPLGDTVAVRSLLDSVGDLNIIRG